MSYTPITSANTSEKTKRNFRLMGLSGRIREISNEIEQELQALKQPAEPADSLSLDLMDTQDFLYRAILSLSRASR